MALMPDVSQSSLDFLQMEMVAQFRPPPPATPEAQEAAIKKLEGVGFRVGLSMFERQTRTGARFKDQLDIIKFVCKDYWVTLFGKNADNLRTNHKGVYVLYDDNFRSLTHLTGGPSLVDEAPILLAFTCGLIRGGLASVGVTADVRAEVQSLPACKFNLEVRGN